MAEKEPTVSWQVLLDDAQWDREGVQPPPSPEDRPARRRTVDRRWLWLGSLVLVGVLLGGGLWLWQRAQTGLSLIQQEISDAVQLEATAQSSRNPRIAAALLDPQADEEWRAAQVDAIAKDRSTPAQAQVQDVELVEDIALVRLQFADPDLPQPSRVLRFYRDAPAGWLRTTPVDSFWGAEETWQGEHFVIRYRQLDRDAVQLAAPHIEEVYVGLRGALGLPILPNPTTVVVLPVDQPVLFDSPSGEIHHPSPALLNLPTTVSEDAALFRFLTIYLVNELVRESFDRYAYGESWMWSSLTESGLRNWLLLESGAVQMDPHILLGWLLDSSAQADRQLPDGLAEACQWSDAMGAPLRLFGCTPDLHTGLPVRNAIPPLARLTTTYMFDFSQDASASTNPSGNMWRTETRRDVGAFTSLFVYAAEQYGRERIPALLEALGDYRAWNEVLTAAYGVSADEFEAGWRAWLGSTLQVTE